MALDSIPDREVSIQWFFLPPVVAVFTVLIAGILGSGRRVPVDSALWGLTGLLFIVLTVLYGVFIRQDFWGGLFPVQLIAQGLLLSPAALHSGARMLSWAGVTMAVCGAVLLIAQYCRRGRADVPAESPTPSGPRPFFSSLPLPAAVTDGEGNILSVSDLLLKMTRRPRAATEGEKITSLLPLNQDRVSLGGKEWKILQTPMENDSHYFQLEEIRSAPHAPSASSVGDDAFTDPSTALCTPAYAARRVDGELYRIRRYQRWMSAALLRMTFTYPPGTGTSPEKEDEIFNEYCRFVSAYTREADIACRIRPRDILVVMPETRLEAARDAVSKLSDFQPHLKDLISDFGGVAAVQNGTAFFGTGSGGFGFEEFLHKMDGSLPDL